jgi:cysteinyl-tRNA synthetase
MIKIYNTLSGELEEFKPIKENEVSMYVCGPTVYNYIHIGNARPVIFFDTVRRYFEYKGYKVKYVSNFTDVDDKMITKANEEGISLKEVADKYIAAFMEDTSKVGLKEEGMIRPKATENIGEMIKIVKELETKGFAYESNGDVYFNVAKYDEYAALSHQKIEDLVSGARIEVNENKESPLDFTLWKKSKEGEPSWGSPWGQGRPGWHLECSAMSRKYLGDDFDIHGGGQDLIFPHHENEIAQSKCAHGGTYARYWMHNGYINIKGEKMSKSLGNFTLLRDILNVYEGKVIRFFMLSSHYRKPIDFSDEELNMAKSAIERIENTLVRTIELERDFNEDINEDVVLFEQKLEDVEAKFQFAMDEDFNTARAIGVIFEFVKELNKFMDNGFKSKKAGMLLRLSREFIKNVVEEVLGVKLNLEVRLDEGLTGDLMNLILDIRLEAKKDKNYALADKIRDRLGELGVEIKDGRDKSTWTLKK